MSYIFCQTLSLLSISLSHTHARRIVICTFCMKSVVTRWHVHENEQEEMKWRRSIQINKMKEVCTLGAVAYHVLAYHIRYHITPPSCHRHHHRYTCPVASWRFFSSFFLMWHLAYRTTTGNAKNARCPTQTHNTTHCHSQEESADIQFIIPFMHHHYHHTLKKKECAS